MVKYEEVYLHACGGVAASHAGLGRYFRFYNAERRPGAGAPHTQRGVCGQRLMAQGSVTHRNQRGQSTLIGQSNNLGPLLMIDSAT